MQSCIIMMSYDWTYGMTQSFLKSVADNAKRIVCCMQGRSLSVMDICCGLGTVSLAGRELTRAVRAKHPWDNRGFAVQTRLPQHLPHATESVLVTSTARQPCALCACEPCMLAAQCDTFTGIA